MKVVSVNNISKRYRLGTISSGRLSDDLTSFLYKLFNKENPNQKINFDNDLKINTKSNHVWALKNISFNLKKGEVLGIIGKNGSGKSTLLKIISRITSPNNGSIKIHGRVSSLLEVGTGFHPELTGRENIFLNGTMMGLRKSEIENRLEQIIEYSGIRNYIDTPIKRYSSGMRVRLGFSISAHLNPDILIIDEVLAVGDIEFKNKAINTMKDFVKSKDKTIIFVSHDLELIKMLCSRSILLEKGKVIFDGNKLEAIKFYNDICNKNGTIFQKKSQINFDRFSKDLPFNFLSMSLKNDHNHLSNSFSIRENIYIELEFIIKKTNPGLMINFEILNNGEVLINSHLNDKYEFSENNLKNGKYITVTKIPKLLLRSGIYQIRPSMGIMNSQISDNPPYGLTFLVNDNVRDLELTSFGPRAGKILFNHPWLIKTVES